MMLITALSGTTDLGSMNDSDQPWQHLCITYDGLQGRIYRNSQKVYEEYWPEVDLGQIYAGIGHHDNSQFFNGAIDEIKLYKSALTDSQVDSLYTRTIDCILLYGSHSDVSGPDGFPDCRIDLYDYTALTTVEQLVIFAADWLSCGLYPDCD